jgi:4-hydroxy-tetrahydrodipicolinate synthase
MKFTPAGVIPAVLLPFQDDLSIDAESFRRHLRSVAATRGVSALTLNAHSTEVHACTPEEQRQVLELAVDTVGDSLPIVAGIYADGTQQAQALARVATQGGASALLVFPPHTIGSLDGQDRPEMALTHFRALADATDLPLIVFQYPGAYAYPIATLLKMVEEIPSIVAIKDWSPPAEHERNIRLLQNLARPVNVLSTNSAWLMSSLAMGPKGLLSGSGSVISDLQVALFEAMTKKDLATAQRINERILPTAQCFYEVRLF